MLCPHCGKETPDNQRYCQYCGSKIKTKEHIAGIIIIVLSIILFMIIAAYFLLNIIINNNNSVVRVPITTTPTESHSIDYKSKILKEMTYYYNSDWEIDDYDNGTIYDGDDGRFVVEYTTFDRKSTYNDVEEDVEGIKEINSDDELTLIESESNIDFNFGNIETYYFSGTYTNDSGNDWYYDYYAFLQEDTMFTMIFMGAIENRKTEFDESKEYILKHIEFSEPVTEEPTTEEPTTEEPTEPPTEKPTDITEPMTLLYEDSEISVYFSDIEPNDYRDDRIYVHLFIDNKMNSQIEFSADTVILDGISYNDTSCGDIISAKTRGIIEITVDRCNNISPSTVGTDLKYYNPNNYKDRVELNIVSQSVK